MGKIHKVSDYKPLSFKTPYVELQFDLDADKTMVKSTQQVERTPHCEASEKLILDCKDLELVSLSINGKKLEDSDYEIKDDQLIIHNPPEAEKFQLEIENVIRPQTNKSYGGIYRSGDKQKTNEIFTSHCEAEQFRRITPYIDRPDNLATFKTTMIADREKNPILLCNGNEIEYGKIDDKRHFAVRLDEIPKPSYLFALVAGQLPAMTDCYITQTSGKRVTLNIFSEDKSKASRTYFGLQTLKNALGWDEKRYGIEYDLDNYNIVGVRLFNAGAMENKGLNIFLLDSILASNGYDTDATFEWVMTVVAHEFAHNKSGNIVTIEKWPDLSLKEGLTTLIEREYVETVRGPVLPRIEDVDGLRTRQFAEDSSPNAHAVRPETYRSIDNFYTTTIYYKGAEVFGMLRTLMGDDLWVKGLNRYFNTYRGQAASLEKFVDLMSEVAERDLTQFFRWYTQAGTPIIDFEDHYDPDSKTYQITFRQHTDVTPGQDIKLPLHIPISMGLLDTSGKEIPLQLGEEKNANGTSRVLELTQAEQTFTFVNVPNKPVPSLFRHFSAPIKFGNTPFTEADYQFLMAHDTDHFNRWDSAQKLLEAELNQLMDSIDTNKTPVVSEALLKTCQSVLSDDSLTPGLKAKMLKLPRVGYMMNQMQVAKPELLRQAIDVLNFAIAKALEPQLLETYQYLKTQGSDDFTPENAEIRSLKNYCLNQLMVLNQQEFRPEIAKMARKQMLNSQNQTDVQTAMQSIYWQRVSSTVVNWDKVRQGAFNRFVEKYHNEASILDAALVATGLDPHEDCIDKIKLTLENKALFDVSDPSNVRSLLRTFAYSNLNVHNQSGEGYKLLVDVALKVDEQNSSTSAMLIKPLMEFIPNADEKRFHLLAEQIERLKSQPKLSDEVQELVDKSLEAISARHKAHKAKEPVVEALLELSASPPAKSLVKQYKQQPQAVEYTRDNPRRSRRIAEIQHKEKQQKASLH